MIPDVEPQLLDSHPSRPTDWSRAQRYLQAELGVCRLPPSLNKFDIRIWLRPVHKVVLENLCCQHLTRDWFGHGLSDVRIGT